MAKNFYLTTPIYYVNDIPHIGHLYTTVAADIIARFKRLSDYEVMFSTGTDEHGQKIAKVAKEKNIDPKLYVDNISQNFKQMMEIFNITNDDFVRTTEDRHKQCAISIWRSLENNGHIYLDKYAGWYSVRDEAFFTENEIIDGKAPSGAEVEWVEEESYFFNLSKWQDKLLEFYDKNPDFIYPKSRKNEVISFVKSGLNDLSISRTSFDWGIKVPDNNKHIMYVWLDALTNYLTVLDYPDKDSNKYRKFWPADIHLVGKDILRFHAIYWPAFLMAAGLELPKKIVAHGWWTKDGQKMSKSVGNVVSVNEMAEQFGIDQTRYFLMREITFGNDGDFNKSAVLNRINSELSNKIGNLLQRTLSLIIKNCDSQIPYIDNNVFGEDLIKAKKDLFSNYKTAINLPEFSSAIGYIVSYAEKANIFIDKEAPWQLKKTDIIRMKEVLYILAEANRVIALLLLPFISRSANKMLDLLNIDHDKRNFNELENCIESGIKINNAIPVFPKIEV